MPPTTIPACSAALLLVACAGADTRTFDNEDGDYLWFSDANWDPDGVPGLSDEAIVATDGVVLAQSMLVEVSRLECTSGLRLAGISGLTVLGDSRITGFEIATSLNAPIIADGPLLIDGMSVFSSTPVFRGFGTTTIEGQMRFGSGHFLDPGVQLVIAGTADDQATGLTTPGGRAEEGAVCRITGTFITRSGFFTSIGSGKWVVDGGTMEYFGELPRGTGGRIQMDSGTIRATLGQWELNNHDIRGGTIDAIGGGRVRLNRTSVSSTRIDATRYSNDGDSGSVEIRGSVTLGAATNSITGGGSSLTLRNNTFTLDGDLTNQGNLGVLSNVTLNGPGEILSTGLLALGGTLNTVARVSGGVATNFGSLQIGVSGLVDVGSGGVYQPVGGLSAPNNVGGRVRISGLLENDPDVPGNMSIRVPVDLESGGAIVSNGEEVQLRWGGVWSGGTIDLAAPMPGDAAVVMLGEGDAFQITGDVTVTNSGLGALNTFFMGPGFGTQPDISIDGSITIENTIARVRAPSITGSGTITGRGAVLFERTITVEPTIVNEAGMAFNSQIRFSAIRNDGNVEQRNQVIFRPGSTVINAGTWEVEASSNLQTDAGGAAGSVFINAGTFRGDSPLNATASVRFENAGTVIADAGAFLHFTDAVTSTTNPDGTTENAIRGSWRRINTGRITFDPPPTQIGPAESTPDERHRIEGDGDSTPWLEGVKRMKDTDARVGDTTFTDPVKLEKSTLTIEEDAEVDLPGIDADQSKVELERGATLRSSGPNRIGFDDDDKDDDEDDEESGLRMGQDVSLVLEQPVRLYSVIDDVEGVIEIGGGSRGTEPVPPVIRTPRLIAAGGIIPASGGLGSMTIDGDLEMGAGAELRVDTAGPGATDRLDVTGTAALDGRVVLNVDAAFLPEIGDEVLVMTAAGGFTGAINGVDAPPVEGVRWRTRIVGTEFRVLAACPADLATPLGVLDLSDINAFVSGFLAQHPDADLTGDGVFDLSDITAFVGFFKGGC